MSEFRGKPDQTADATDTGISFATWQDRQLSVILARTEQLLCELRAAASATDGRKPAQQDELHSEVAYWQAKAAALDTQLEEQTAIQADLRASEQRLQEEVARLREVEKNYTDENQALSWIASSSSLEAANLRRLVTELQTSLSWRITAPLRFLTKPLFRLVAPAVSAPVIVPEAIVPAARPPALRSQAASQAP